MVSTNSVKFLRGNLLILHIVYSPPRNCATGVVKFLTILISKNYDKLFVIGNATESFKDFVKNIFVQKIQLWK